MQFYCKYKCIIGWALSNCGKDLLALEQQLRTELHEHYELVKTNRMPFGQPKVANCQSREDLAAHPIDVKWLTERGA